MEILLYVQKRLCCDRLHLLLSSIVCISTPLLSVIGVFFPSLSILMRLRRGHSSVYPFDSDVLSGLVLSFFRSVLFRFEYFLGGTSSWCTYVQTRPMTRLPETSIIPCICHNLRCIFSRFSSIITTSTFFNRQWLKYVYLVVFFPSISTE